jgi:hypothetical protein
MIKSIVVAALTLVGAMTVSATPVLDWSVKVNGAAAVTGAVPSKTTSSSIAGSGAGYSWAISGWDIDPFFNWTFTSTLPGVYTVGFFMPYVGGPYTTVVSSASGTLTPGKKSVTAKDITITTEIPGGTPTGQVLKLADTTLAPPFSGVIAAKSDVDAFLTPASGTYGVVLKFTHLTSGSVTFNGRLELFNPIPEPGTMALAGFALVGLGLIARRK